MASPVASLRAGALFDGDGEMRARCRALDWASTELGRVEEWPERLASSVSLALSMAFPAFVLWGPRLVQVYNDAYIDLVSDYHPAPLGASVYDSFPGIENRLGPFFAEALSGRTVLRHDEPSTFMRHGRLQTARFTFSYAPISLETGEVGGIFVTLQETTAHVASRELQAEREQMLRSLTAERSRLAEIFRLSPSYFALLRGSSHVFELANSRYIELVGGRDVIGKPILEALPEIAGQGFVEILDRVLLTGEPFVGREVPLKIERDGRTEEVFVDISYQALKDVDGARIGVIAHGFDVTEQVLSRQQVEQLLREAEESRDALIESELRFRLVQDASPDASLLLRAVRNDDGRLVDFVFTYANAATVPVLLERDEPIVGRLMTEAFPESVAAGRLEVYAKVVETGVPWVQDIFYTHRSVSHGLRVTAVKVGDGIHIGAADLTKRMKAEAELEAALIEAENARRDADEANRAKSAFLATMSHELRTPLNAIAGYVDLLEMGIRGPVTATQREDLARIKRSQQHLLGLINDVLNFVRLDTGQLSYAIEDVHVAQLVGRVEELILPQLSARGLRYSRAVIDPAVTMRADSEKALQILVNLLTNATKFTESGGTISVKCTLAEDAVSFAVSDTGSGIPADRLDSVFEPFVQIGRGLTQQSEGVGLGLAISRDLARKMGGDVTAVSTLGAGSTFTLRLPR